MRRRWVPTILLGLTLALGLTTAAAGQREVVEAGNLYLADNGGIFPSKLPRHGKAPVTARLIGELGTRDGAHPPAVEDLEIDIDRSIEIDAVGLPACQPSQLNSRSTGVAEQACRSAIVGSGEAEVEVAFPEQEPFSAKGPIVVFNGGVRGKTTTVLLHTYVNVPAPTAIITKATVTRIHRGRFGLRIAAHIPRIAGGAGSVTRFELKIGRRYTYRAQKKSFLSAGCPTGHWATKGNVRFDDGTNLGLTHIFPCTPLP